MSVSEPLVQSVLLGDAVEHAPVAILVADDEMRYVAANQYACELLGYTREELLQMRVTDVVRYPNAAAEYDAMLARGELTGTAVLTRKDGSEVTFHYRASKTRIAKLQFFVAVGFVEDGRR